MKKTTISLILFLSIFCANAQSLVISEDDKKENEIVDGERGEDNEESTPERTNEAR